MKKKAFNKPFGISPYIKPSKNKPDMLILIIARSTQIKTEKLRINSIFYDTEQNQEGTLQPASRAMQSKAMHEESLKTEPHSTLQRAHP